MGFGFQNTPANAQESKTEDSFPFWRTLFWIETIQIVWIFVIAEQTSGKTIDPYTGGGGGVTSYNDGEAPPESGTFFTLSVFERVGISLVEVYQRLEKSVNSVGLKAQKG